MEDPHRENYVKTYMSRTESLRILLIEKGLP
jgi:hypothetical protein